MFKKEVRLCGADDIRPLPMPLLLQFLRETGRAEDVVPETFAGVLRSLPCPPPKIAPLRLLLGLSYN